jgi:hypothetical protein
MAGLVTLLTLIWNWLTVPGAPWQKDYDSALSGIGTVSGVVWAGGFVVRSFWSKRRPNLTWSLMLAMNFLQNAFMTVTFALFAAPHGLRLAAIGYLVFYIPNDSLVISAAVRHKRGIVDPEPTGSGIASTLRKLYSKIAPILLTKGSVSSFVVRRALLHGGFAFFLAFPTSLCVAVVAWCWTLIGMWSVLQRLYDDLYFV